MGITEDSRTILVVEIQCQGFEHATVNAALLQAIHIAYPATTIIFMAEKSHLDQVKMELLHHGSTDNIRFESIAIPDRKASGYRRLPREIYHCLRILFSWPRDRVVVLVFCSITGTSLLPLKYFLRIHNLSRPTIAIIHGCLSTIVNTQTWIPMYRMIALKQVLRHPHPRQLRLIALSESILANVIKVNPAWRQSWSVLPLGYFEPKPQGTKQTGRRSPGLPLCFGFLGAANSNKRLDLFCKLADDIAPHAEAARFLVAGHYVGPLTHKPHSDFISSIPDYPVEREQFAALVHHIDYVVSIANPEHYRLTASATFLDALFFAKPGIYLRNDYISHFFGIMGDIGYLCDSYDDIVQTVRQLISNFPSDRYERQVACIQSGRSLFKPQTLAPRFRAIVEELTV